MRVVVFLDGGSTSRVAAREYEHVAGIRTQEASDPGIRQAFSNLKANGQQERS